MGGRFRGVAGSVIEHLKGAGRLAAERASYRIGRLQPAASHLRPIGDDDSVFEDFRARGFNPRLVFDVGASDGAWTRKARRVFPDARYVLVEPRETGLAGAVKCVVGAREGTATLTDWDTGSTALPVDPGGARRRQVPMTTLDRLAAEHGMPEWVKLDVEGFELEALAGASTLLGATELFVIETSLFRFQHRPMLHELVRFMADRQYYVYDVAGFIRRPFDGALALVDLCFARALRGSETEWFRHA